MDWVRFAGALLIGALYVLIFLLVPKKWRKKVS